MNLIAYLTPTNLASEKERFFSSHQYNPIFRYIWDEPEALEWSQQNLKTQKLAQALKNQDSQAIQQVAEDLFETKITPELLTSAKQITSVVPSKNQTEPIEKIVMAFEKAFAFLGLDGYCVEIVDQHGFNFRPIAQQKKVVVSRHLNCDFFSVDGEVKHELTHIIRYENGQYNHISIAENYLPTEEGLATYCQDYAGHNGQNSLFQHAAEYTMTEVSLTSSLREVTQYLQEIGFSKELAWQRAIRHKFGFRDTSSAGDIMKPSMYFLHEQLVKQLQTDEKYRLFVGKITKKQLLDFPTYQGKIPLQKLQEFYTLGKE
jgi:hypothetical protein